MSAKRADRATRIAELRERAVREAQGALAEAARAVAAARDVVAHVERTWSAQAERLRACASPAELADASAYLGTLRKRAEQAHANVVARERDEAAMREKVQQARMEQRKIELWRDGIVQTVREEELRIERLANDELAARMTERAR